MLETEYTAGRGCRAHCCAAAAALCAHFRGFAAAIDMWAVGCILGELLWTLEPAIAERPAGADRSSHARALFPGESAFPLSGDGLAANDQPNAQVSRTCSFAVPPMRTYIEISA